MPGEFELIRRYFRDATPARSDVLLGIDDDCALVRVPPDHLLAVSSDTLVGGRHFREDAEPEAVGHKALAVNLSDLAAMGAEPAWASLCLTLPQADETWLRAFMHGFAALADEFGVQLIGGDTTRGPLSVGVTVQGFVEPEHALRRDRAVEGDLVYVSGTLGDAGLALQVRCGGLARPVQIQSLDQRLDRPWPRVELGRRLAAYSRCAIDISDGLAADLGHVCEQSGVGAELELDLIPLSDPVRNHTGTSGDWSLPLSAGDDYELLFTVPPGRQAVFEREALTWEVPVTRIGVIDRGEGVRLRGVERVQSDSWMAGYDHFRE
jgi:thiamine-monophosphate kinase